MGQKEVLADFQALAQEPIDEAAIKERIKLDKSKEAQVRVPPGPGVSIGVAAVPHARGSRR